MRGLFLWTNIRAVPKEPTVRRFEPHDAAALRALAPQLTSEMPPWRPSDGLARAARRWVEDAIAQSDADDRGVFVAETCGVVAGFVDVHERMHFSSARDAYIGELVVDPRYRRGGIARRLVEAALAWAQHRNVSRVYLETGSRNEAALALYRTMGFVEEQIALSIDPATDWRASSR